MILGPGGCRLRGWAWSPGGRCGKGLQSAPGDTGGQLEGKRDDTHITPSHLHVHVHVYVVVLECQETNSDVSCVHTVYSIHVHVHVCSFRIHVHVHIQCTFCPISTLFRRLEVHCTSRLVE